MSNSFRPKNRQDFVAGLFFVGLGFFGIVFGRGYAVGTISRMGPGYLPMAMSYALIIIGTFIAMRAIRRGESRIEACSWRPIVFVLGSIFVFALTIPRGGLAISTMLVVILSSFGTPESRWRDTIVLGTFMALLTAMVFIQLLGLPISVWPR